jgi:hypothetical protein
VGAEPERDMTPTRRLALKIAWMAVQVGLLVLLGQVQHDFVYRAF